MIDLDKLVDAWDDVDRACSRVETSLPQQMSEAIADLENTRLAFRSIINNYAMTVAICG